MFYSHASEEYLLSDLAHISVDMHSPPHWVLEKVTNELLA